MQPGRCEGAGLHESARAFYCRAIAAVNTTGVPFLIGGAYAFERYTGISRHTKDLDFFLRPADVECALSALARAGCTTEITCPHWLAKAFHGDDYIDVIFRFGNGLGEVDDAWFEHAEVSEILGCRVRLCSPEEIIWSKGFVHERDRYDGADIVHLLHARAESLDWPRLLGRFEPQWQVLLSHLILFGFVYPSERTRIPAWLTRELLLRAQEELSGPPLSDRLCQGTLISGEQYLVDVERWGYLDARLEPWGKLTPEQIEQWKASLS